MAKVNSATLDDLLKQLKTMNRLMAAQLKKEMSQQDLVRLLMNTELTNQELADVLDTTAATVAVTLQRLRRKAAPKTTTAGPPPALDDSGAVDTNG